MPDGEGGRDLIKAGSPELKKPYLGVNEKWTSHTSKTKDSMDTLPIRRKGMGQLIDSADPFN